VTDLAVNIYALNPKVTLQFELSRGMAENWIMELKGSLGISERREE